MERQDMIKRLRSAVNLYIEDSLQLGSDAQIAISLKDFMVNIQTAADRDEDIYESDATVEATAVAEGLADQDGMDYQTSRNWDLYPVFDLIRRDAKGKAVPDDVKIAAIVDSYLKHPDNSRTPYTY